MELRARARTRPEAPEHRRYRGAVRLGGVGFDLYVFDADDVPGQAELQALLDNPRGPAAPPTGRLRGLFTEMEKRWPESGGVLESPWSGWPLWQPLGDDGCALSIRWPEAKRMRADLLEACGRHGVALYDPQEDVLLRSRAPGPDHELSFRLLASMEGVEATWPDPSATQIFDLIADLNERNSFLILERIDCPDATQYAQIRDAYAELGAFQVEYRDGGPHAHYQAQVPIVHEFDDWVSHDTVARVLQMWAANDDGWRTALPWRPLDLG
jgi:hypothetical protein